MRDEMDARLWTAHHDQFSAAISDGARVLTRRLGKIEPGHRFAGQLLAVVLATSLTLITLGASIT
jgi:hypothetical protein